jgi:methionine synthase II (cobalamin-independent)
MVPGANIPRSFPLPRRSAMLDTTIAGSLPKPSWLAEPEKLWAPWRLEGAELEQGKRDAALVWIKEQEDAGIDIVTEGEQFRTHFVHGFLEHIDGIDWQKKTRMGIRDNRYVVDVPTVTGALGRKRPVHKEEARFARTHTKRGLKFTLPGPMTICDTIADAHYGRRPDMAMAFAELLNAEARELEAEGVDLIQFDEPAFNVFMDDVKEWGIAALHKAIEGLTCRTAVHICYGYGIQDRRAYLLRLRHPGQSRLEGEPRQRMAPIRGDLPGPERQPDRPGLAGMRRFEGAAVADRAAVEEDRNGRRHRRCDRDGRNPREGRRHPPRRHGIRRCRADQPLHQLRHGAAAARRRRRQAAGARRRRGAAAQGAFGRLARYPAGSVRSRLSPAARPHTSRRASFRGSHTPPVGGCSARRPSSA